MSHGLARVVVLGVGAAVLASVAGGVGCFSPTEMRVSILTDTPCSQGTTTGIYTSAFGSASAAAVATTTTCTPQAGTSLNFLGDLVMVPRASRDATIEIEIRLAPDGNPDGCYGAAAGKCIVARRTIAFIAHTSRDLPIRLDQLCSGNYCDPITGTTCLGGTCVTADTTQATYCGGPTGTVPCEQVQDGGGPVRPQKDAAPPIADSGFSFVFCDASAQCQASECCCPNLPATPACDRANTCKNEGPGCLP